MLVRQVINPRRAGDVANALRASTAGWFDAAAKLRRRRRRARRALALRAILALAGILITIYFLTTGGLLKGVFVGALSLGLVIACAQSARYVWQLDRMPMPEPTPELPPPGSMARKPMETLKARERALTDLLSVLGPMAGDTGTQAAEAAAALRTHARCIVAVETAAQDGGPEVAAGLETMQDELERGVRAYARLVAAAATVVSASRGKSVTEVPQAKLRDATDALTGMARGLQEIDPAV
ncbi:MAG TPA: hypothetical protein VHC49_26490 [Mycobacteriales bacterium]|nr:hypothetical protein [Mycobacteriales bacterium]